MTITNSERAQWAGKALNDFRHATGCDPEDCLGDLLTDLMHWSVRNNFNFDLAMIRAQGHYEAERAEEAQAAADLLSAAQAALDYLTDHAIDLEGEEEALLAGIRIDLADAIAAAKGGVS